MQCVFVIRSGMLSGLYLKRLVAVHSLLGMRLETLLIADAGNNSSVLFPYPATTCSVGVSVLICFWCLHVLLNMSTKGIHFFLLLIGKKLIAFGGK